MPAVQRAQHNLCRKLGLLTDEMQPIKAALQEFLAMFQGPLPQDVITALTVAFNLEDPVAEELDEAMAVVAGEAIADIQEANNNLQAEALQAATRLLAQDPIHSTPVCYVNCIVLTI